VDRSSAVSTSALFVADNRQGWQIIDSANAGVIDTLNLPAIAHKAIQDDLDGNFLVVLRPESNDGMTTWWRIHRQSGESLGMLASEHWLGGANMTEYSGVEITIAIVVLAIALALLRIAIGDLGGTAEKGIDNLFDDLGLEDYPEP
jgi:hypothetical protein